MNTSEFARICRTERRTIHYYDAIGLLKPDHVQENGYREYSAEQSGIAVIRVTVFEKTEKSK